MDRRTFLTHTARLGALGLAASARPLWLADAVAAQTSPFLERNAWPEHWETKLPSLAGKDGLTPNAMFFVRSHFPVPEVDPADYALEIDGLVERPLRLDAAALRGSPRTETLATLECAGNGRGLFDLPNTSGTQWGRGAVGTALWAGPSIAALLEQAGVKAEAKHLWFEADDRATLPQAPPFLRSVPLALALRRGLLAHSMNGQPLPTLHGGPLRFVLPGWYGMAWAKWVRKIRVEAAPSDNHFMAKGYRYVAPGGDPAASPPVEEMRVKSVIVAPLDGAHVPATAKVEVRGYAWTGAGDGTIRAVDVSGDGGATWMSAALDRDVRSFAWRAFRADVLVRGDVLARATDGTGAVQPIAALVNAGGYGNNSIHRVRVHARA